MTEAKMALSEKHISTEVAMVTNELTDSTIYTGLFGTIDSARINTIATKVTQLCESKDSSVAILDLGNVDAIDTAVAGYLNDLGRILTFVGVTPIICGISGELSRTTVKAGVRFDDFIIVRNLKEALSRSYEITGHKVVKIEK